MEKKKKKNETLRLDSLTEPSVKYLQRYRVPLKGFDSVNTLHTVQIHVGTVHTHM